jgi:hypothetical protein
MDLKMDKETVASPPGSDDAELFHPLELLWHKIIPSGF